MRIVPPQGRRQRASGSCARVPAWIAIALALLVFSGWGHTARVDAIGGPVLVDNFNGTTIGTRTVTLLPLAGTDLTAPGTFSQSNGLATMTMNGNGNAQGGVQLDYAISPAVDLTSGGNNAQIFTQFAEIICTTVSDHCNDTDALSYAVSVTDSNGATGTLETGIGQTFAFSPAIPFSGIVYPNVVDGVTTFLHPDFTHVAHIRLLFLYNEEPDPTGQLTVEIQEGPTSPASPGVEATPSGGAPPAPPVATVSLPGGSTVCGNSSTPINFQVAFTSDGKAAPVTTSPPPVPNHVGLTSSELTISGTAPGVGSPTVRITEGPSTYHVAVSGITGNGTVITSVLPSVVQDTWGQSSVASTDDPTANFTLGTAPSISTNPSDRIVIAPGTATFTAAASGTPTPTVQWQVEPAGSNTFSDIQGATNSTYTTPPTAPSDNGNKYQAVFTNCAGTQATTPALLTVQYPLLAVSKVHNGTFTQADTADTYTVTVSNSGTAATNGQVTVTDTLPAALSPTAADNATIDGWACAFSGQVITCTSSAPIAANGGSSTITLTVAVAANAPTSATNTAGAFGGNDSAHATAGTAATGSDRPSSKARRHQDA